MGRQEGRTDATVTVTRVERVGFQSRLEDIKEHTFFITRMIEFACFDITLLVGGVLHSKMRTQRKLTRHSIRIYTHTVIYITQSNTVNR
jgi:hypothetical protein